MTAVRLSVSVVTYGRPDSLARTLASLRAQDVQPWEVVVSDDSGPGEAATVRAVAEQYGCRYVEGPRRGLYANRNAAALACRGTHIRTMDDDHEFPAGHFAACLAAIGEDPDAIWALGEWIPAWGELRGPVAGPGEIDARGGSVLPRDPQRSSAIADGATIFPRQVFDDGVRYAEEFTFGPAYLELGERLAHLGYRIRHLGSTHVIHHATPRSIRDPETIDAARMYATICHSFLYRPTMGNRVVTSLKLLRMVGTHPRSRFRSLRRAVTAYRRRRRELGAHL